MGCRFSSERSSQPLRRTKPWKMDFSKYDRTLNENDLEELRIQFWYDRVDNNLDIWAVLRKCCEACLKNDYTTANQLFSEASLHAVHHDLSEVIDEEGLVYHIDKYCFSDPSNLMVGKVEEDTSVVVGDTITYQIRIQSTLTEQPIQLSLAFDQSDTIATAIEMVKNELQSKYHIENISSIKLIYRGFVMDTTKKVSDFTINPEYVILAIVN